MKGSVATCYRLFLSQIRRRFPMRSSHAQTTRVAASMLALASLFISLTPRIPAAPTAPAEKKQSKAATAVPSSDSTKMRVQEAYGKLPLSFEPNQGQTDRKVKYLARGSGYTLFLTQTEATLALYRNEEDAATPMSGAHQTPTPSSKSLSSVVRMKLKGANPAPQVSGEGQMEGRSNYLVGNDKSKWRTNVPRFSKVRYSEVYRGVDIIYYGTSQRELEYDFLLAPNADPRSIKLAFDGAEQIVINEQGELVLGLKGGEEVVQRAPQIYQEAEGRRETVAGRYVLKSKSEVGFELGKYDPSRPLVIDPRLIYATYYGGSGDDLPLGIAVDRNGNAYVTGRTNSTNLPLKTPIQSQLNPGSGSHIDDDAFVVKFNSNGTDIIYATYLGGQFEDEGRAIAVTDDGKAVITGSANLSSLPGVPNNFPVTLSALQTETSGGEDAFLTELSADGHSLVYSTLLRATAGNGVAVDGAGKIYVVGDLALP